MCIFVRSLTNEEGNHLLKVIRKGKEVVSVRRAEIILASAQGMKTSEIAKTYHCSDDHVRDVIHFFNQEGLECLKPKYCGGRPFTFTPEQRSDIIELAQIPPNILGLPFTQWSLSKLQEEVIRRKIVKSISHETLRQILNEANITYQNTKTWKASNDPEFESKKNASRNSTKTRRKTDG